MLRCVDHLYGIKYSKYVAAGFPLDNGVTLRKGSIYPRSVTCVPTNWLLHSHSPPV